MCCRLLRENLERSWRQLQPTCEVMCQQAAVTAKPSYHDWKWAYSVWWCVLLAVSGAEQCSEPELKTPRGAAGVLPRKGQALQAMLGLTCCWHEQTCLAISMTEPSVLERLEHCCSHQRMHG